MDYCGLAAKAGKVVCGADAVEEAMMRKKVFVVLIAEDASAKTKEKFERSAEKANIPYYFYGNIDQNSKVIGKKNKAILAIKDKNFSNAICQIINGGDTIG